MSHIREKIEQIKNYIDKNNYNADIMAVTKSIGVTEIIEAYNCGVKLFGENRWQVAKPKLQELNEKNYNLDFFFIGHLQKNKVKYVIRHFKGIYSVDSYDLALSINEYINKNNLLPMDILIEVNVSGEAQKYGVLPDDAIQLYEQIKDMQFLKLKGIMSMGPLTEDKTEIRKSFKKARNIFDEIAKYADDNWNILSTGMSDDFPIALEEGSTLIRIGRGIFAPEVVLPI